MPFPLSTVMVLGAIALSHYATEPLKIIVWVLVGGAILNEVVRFWVLRPSKPSGEYTIPTRERTPIRYDDASE